MLTSHMTVVGSRALGRRSGLKGGALMREISALTEEMPENNLTPPTTWEHGKKTELSMNQETGPHQPLNLLALSSWTSQVLELWKRNVCCLRPSFCGALLQEPEIRQLLVLSLYHATSSLFYTTIKISVLGMGSRENKIPVVIQDFGIYMFILALILY